MITIKNLVYLLLLFLTFSSHFFSQIIKSYGIKGGMLISGLSTGDNNVYFDEDVIFVNFIGYDIGIFTEMFNTKKFVLSTELHYNVKGENNPNPIKAVIPEETSQGSVYKLKYVDNRLHYLSLQVLPRYHFILSKDESLFLTGGPALDYLFTSASSDGDDILGIKPGLEFAAIGGVGALINDYLFLEFRFQHNFTPVYTFSNNGIKTSRENTSLMFIVGYALKAFKNKL